MKSFVLVLLVVFLLSLFLGCISTPNQNNEVDKNSFQVIVDKNPVVVFETTKGIIEIELYKKEAPITVENFINYVNSGHYNGTIFHRVISGFMIQGGGFDVSGVERKTNPPITLESKNGLHNTIGMVAMARTKDPNSATSQFFINTVVNPPLDYSEKSPGYAVFGKVISGMDTVYKIEGSKTGSHGFYQDWPKENIIITNAYMK